MIKETSIIIPTFNQAKYLDRCLRSVLSQNGYDDYEVICVNDGSSDETAQILSRYQNEIQIIDNVSNQGLPASINRAILQSTGQFIVRVDSDDYVSREFIRVLTLGLKYNAKIDSVACDYEIFDEMGVSEIANCIESPIACGILFRRAHLFDIGLYDEKFRIHEDKELMTRFLRKYGVERIPIPLYRYRMHTNNMTKNLEKSDEYLTKLKNKRGEE